MSDHIAKMKRCAAFERSIWIDGKMNWMPAATPISQDGSTAFADGTAESEPHTWLSTSTLLLFYEVRLLFLPLQT